MRSSELTDIKPCVDCGTKRRDSIHLYSRQTNEICERCVKLREIVETESGSIQEYDRFSRTLRVAGHWTVASRMLEAFDIRFRLKSRAQFGAFV